MRSCPDWLQLHCLQRFTQALEYECRRYFRSRFISHLARRPACGSLHEPSKGGCRGRNRQWSGCWVRSCFSQCSLRWWSTPWRAKTGNPVWTTTFWGERLTAWVIASSLILTNLSTEHLIGLNADAFSHTVAVMAWETTAALARESHKVEMKPRRWGRAHAVEITLVTLAVYIFLTQ